MRFLPNRTQYPYDDFWSILVNLIERKLSSISILFPQSGTSLCKISDLRELDLCFCDRHGEPLFRDVIPTRWLSRQYQRDDVRILKGWGMHRISVQEILTMIQEDLDRPDSRMRSEQTDDNWQARAATMLLRVATSRGSALSTLRTFKLIPCRGDPTYWISRGSISDPNTICFAETEEGIPIPDDLGLQIVTSKASKIPARVAFLKLLGVTYAKTSEVRDRIYNRHQAYLTLTVSTPICTVVDQLRFLYLADHKDPQNSWRRPPLVLKDHLQEWWVPSSNEPLYLSDCGPYGPRELLGVTHVGEEPGAGAPGMSVRFLHDSFTNNPPEKPSFDSTTWSDWLRTRAGVQRSLRLTKMFPNDLSPECYYVAKHRPEKFVGLLRFNLLTEGISFSTYPILQEKLEQVEVLCQDGHMTPLWKTYLPLPDLREECNKFLTGSHSFPFVKLEDKISRDTYQALNWDFLINLAGVGVERDLDFYLHILEHLRVSAQDGNTGARVVDLYVMIYSKFTQHSITRDVQAQRIK